jgi:hypothetical protein
VTLNEFATITRQVIARDGFDGFQPTACIPSRRELAVLAGIPPNVDVQAAATSWAVEKAGPNEEVLVAFSISSTQFKTVRIAGNERDEAIYEVE